MANEGADPADRSLKGIFFKIIDPFNIMDNDF